MPDIHKDEPDPIDIAVGARVRRRRLEVGLSQSALGDVVGVTFQQVQKYERGANRVSASMLAKVAKALSAPIAYFFEDVAELAENTAPDGLGTQFLSTPAGRKLAGAFVKLKPTHQQVIADAVVGLTH